MEDLQLVIDIQIMFELHICPLDLLTGRREISQCLEKATPWAKTPTSAFTMLNDKCLIRHIQQGEPPSAR